MTTKTLTLSLPEQLVQSLENAAAGTYRSVDDLVATALGVALVDSPDLPPEVAKQLAEMMWYSDDALWAAAESSLSPAEQRRLEQLNGAADIRSLSKSERTELDDLLERYDFAVLRRAKALAILAFRGYEIANHIGEDVLTDDGEEYPETPAPSRA